MAEVLTPDPNSAKIIKRRTEVLTVAEWMLLKRLRTLADSMVIVTVNTSGEPIGWTVLFKMEHPPRGVE